MPDVRLAALPGADSDDAVAGALSRLLDSAREMAVASAALDDPLSAEARAALVEVEQLLTAVREPACSPAERALSRLLTDTGGPDDVVQLGLPLVGARLVVSRHDDRRVVHDIAAELDGDRELLRVLHDGAVVALARNVPRRAGDDKGLRTALRVARAVTRQHPGARCGISAEIREPHDLPAAFRDAFESAEPVGVGAAPWTLVDDVWAELVVGRVRRLAVECLPSMHPLARLADYDRRHGSALASTVATWLSRQCDTVRTAEQLSLHPNTLRYRLKRAQEVSGLDLGNAAQALVAQLVLHSSPVREEQA